MRPSSWPPCCLSSPQLIPKNAFLYGADVLTSLVSPLLYVNYQVLKWCGASLCFEGHPNCLPG